MSLSPSGPDFGVCGCLLLPFQGSPDHAPSLPLALGFGLALFQLRRKDVSLGRAAGLTACGLAAGTLLGVLVESALRVDIIPLGPLSSPAAMVAEGALAGMFAVREGCVGWVTACHRAFLTFRHRTHRRPPSWCDHHPHV